MLTRARRKWLVVILAGSLAVGIAYGWKALGEASAVTTSYSAAVEPRESLAVDAYELLSGVLFFRSTAERLVVGKATHRERLEALMEWAHENVRPQYAAPERIVADNFLDIVRRGYGYCDQTAHVFAALAHFAGYDAHLLFLRAPDGVSPHTVAEVRVDAHWVLVDPWLGTLFLDRGGELAAIADLGTRASLPQGYALLGSRIDEGHFRRATPFETFPYESFSAFLAKVWSRVASKPVADIPDSTGRMGKAATPAHPGVANVPDATELRAEVLQMDGARRAHLEGRYDQAIAGYRKLLAQRLPSDMAESVRFFLGLALLRLGSADQAIVAFDSALETVPRTAWAPSVRYYRAEAKLRTGDVEGAVVDLRAAKIPSAARKLVSLGRSELPR
jgi:tetratricopeptide (TPR) repeat protein